jgi:hypothetical protein
LQHRRDCERSEAIHLTEQKVWIASSQGLLAMTGRVSMQIQAADTRLRSRRDAPELCRNVSPTKSEGVGNAGRHHESTGIPGIPAREWF